MAKLRPPVVATPFSPQFEEGRHIGKAISPGCALIRLADKISGVWSWPPLRDAK